MKKIHRRKSQVAAVFPASLHEFGMYLDGQWYKINLQKTLLPPTRWGAGCYHSLNNILDPVLNIKDQRTDKRIDFVGGIRGLAAELEKEWTAVKWPWHSVCIP